MSPTNNRLSRSFSSDIPTYIYQQKEKMLNENEDESMFDYNKQVSDLPLLNNGKYSLKHNNINIKDLSSEVDDNFNKYRFDKEMAHEGSQLMKSPSMGSIRMDYKEKTAEFEGEDMSQNQASDKKKPDNRSILSNKLPTTKGLGKEEYQVLLVKKENFKKFSKIFNLVK